MTTAEDGRMIAHLFLDAVGAGHGTGLSHETVELVFQGVGEYVWAGHDEAGVARVDLTALVAGVTNLVHWLVDTLANEVGVDFLDVVISARQQLRDAAEE